MASRYAWRFSFAIRYSLFAFAILASCRTAFAQVQMAKIAAHPALWTVHSPTATAYLLGSIHLLPANVVWHTPPIDKAIESADTFVFETPLDDAGKAKAVAFINEHGALPKGELLHNLLTPDVKAEFERAEKLAGVPEGALDRTRPWLASIALEVSYLQHLHYLAADGVDQQLYAYAREHQKAFRYFETPEQQLGLLMPKDEKLELQEFAIALKEFRPEENEIGAMVDAWGAGNVREVAHLVSRDMDSAPEARKLLLDDRNRAWIPIFSDMLSTNHTYFVTVGTGHLVGKNGVPALLRAKGYRVEGP